MNLCTKSLWQEQSDILFRGTYGISPIDAINENFSSNSPPLFAGAVPSRKEYGLTILNTWSRAITFIGGNEGYQLREESAHYKALFGAEKDDIGPENTCFWDVKSE